MKISDIKKGYVALNAGDWIGGLPVPLFKGVRLRVRRLWNPDFTALYEQLMAEGSDQAEADKESRVFDECLLRAALSDWEGIDEPYSPDMARDLLADPVAGPSFRRALVTACGMLTDKVAAQIEADSKN